MIRPLILSLLIVLFSGVQNLHAGGLDMTILYGTRIGSMGGGHISLANDAHAPFYNPAAMSGVDQFALSFNSYNLFFQNKAPIGEPENERSSKFSWGPLFYGGGVYRLNDRIHVGFAIYPTALQGQTYTGVEYNTLLQDKELAVRLMRIEMSPSISFKIVDPLSVGMSYRFGYTRYDKKAGVFAPPTDGIYIDTSVDSWDANGFKFGTHLDDWRGVSAGLTFRPKQSLKLTGDSEIDIGVIDPFDRPTEQHVNIPAQLQAGLSYHWAELRMTFAASYQLTFNSAIEYDDTRIDGDDFPPEATRQPLNYRDGHTVHLGVDYRHPLSSTRSYRVGIGYAFDSAVTNPRYPSPVLPPASAYHGIAAGAGYQWGNHEVGIATNYGTYSDTATDLGDDLIPATVFPGKYSIKVMTAHLDYQWKF